ncbi:MAG TPA: hypothetical protein VIV15_04505, partial [Anaerolineales bacterium]
MQGNARLSPDADRLGMVTASVLLAFAVTRILPAPEFTITLQFPGFYFAIPLTIGTAITILAAGLTASGMNWIIRGHPSMTSASTRQHWLLPTLTTLVTGITLTVINTNAAWWIGFGVTAAIMMLVFIAEYIVVDPAAPSYAAARAGLTALSYALFLILTAALRLAGTRLVILAPVIFLAAGLTALRILHLDGTDPWDYPWAAGIGIVCTQLAAGLHYWPLLPVQFALALTGLLYALTSFS